MRRAPVWLSFALWGLSCQTAPVTGRKQLVLVSQSQMDELGAQAFTEISQQQKKLDDPQVQTFVASTSNRLLEKVGQIPGASGSLPAKWDLAVFCDKDPNAFALPGGHIGVNSGIVPVAENQAGLAVVIGHEIGHVLAGHSRERVSQTLLAQGGLSLVSVALGNAALRGPVLAALGIGAEVGVLLPYSRTQESEADKIGLLLMGKAGFEPSEALAFWGRMKAQGGAQPPTFLSTHPATETRIEDLRAFMPEAQAAYQQSAQIGRGPQAPGVPATCR